MKKSAYFPASAENSVAKDATSTANHQQHINQHGLVPVVRSGGISFPYSACVLWNRDPISFPKQLRSLDAIPPLLLTTGDISLVLQRLQSTPSNVRGDLLVSATHYHDLTEDTKDIIGCPVLGIPRYLFSSDGNTRDQLTIPVSKQVEASALLFEESSTLNLIQNLGKSIRSGREFSLKSCMRIRAAGHASQTISACRAAAGHSGSSTTRTLSGTVRMEAILPNISFQAVQVNSIPILATPLAKHLTSHTSNSAGEAPKMGYLTLNQVRKLVTLQETDTSVPLVPLVGVWVKFGAQHAEPEIAATLLEHPFVWGACVRFLCSDHIQERVHVAQDTFLLTVIVGDSLEYYEVSKLPGGADTSSSVCLSKGTDFLCTDFTVDLSVSLSEDGSPVQREGEAVICRFRPLVRPEHRQSFQKVSPANHPAPTAATPALAAPAPALGRSGKQLFPSTHEGSSIESGSLLAPRPGCPQPMQPPVSPSKQPQYAQYAEVDSLWSQSGEPSGVSPQQRFAELFQSQQGQDVLRLFGALGPVDAPSSSSSFSVAQVDLVRSQQRQIQELRWQVEELRQMVLQLGGRLPADHFLRSSADSRDCEPSSVHSAHILESQQKPRRRVTEDAEPGRVSHSSAARAAEARGGVQVESKPPTGPSSGNGTQQSSRLVQLSAPVVHAGVGADDASEHYTEEEFELDEIDEIDDISDEQDSPNSAESDCDEHYAEEGCDQGDEEEEAVCTNSHHAKNVVRLVGTPSSSAEFGSKANNVMENKAHHTQAVSAVSQGLRTKSGNTATAKHGLGIGASEMDSIYVGASYSGTSSGYSAGLPRSGSGKWGSTSNGSSNVASRAASRINKLLDHEEEHPTLMESESILQIQARYC